MTKIGACKTCGKIEAILIFNQCYYCHYYRNLPLKVLRFITMPIREVIDWIVEKWEDA